MKALFLLVWSCRTPVAQAATRDMAGPCQVRRRAKHPCGIDRQRQPY
jgi:hypothetical protein